MIRPLLAAAAFFVAMHAVAAPVAREVVPKAPGPQRLDLDAIAAGLATSPDLRELRLFDDDGKEVPYLAILPAPAEATLIDASQVAPIPVTKTASGFEADFGEARDADRLRIEGLPSPMMKRFRLDVSADREHWTTAVPEATLFDLPDEALTRLEADFERTPVRFARVTWDDASSARMPLPARVLLRPVVDAQAEVILREPLTVTPRPAEPRTTRLELALPGKNLPLRAIVVETGKPRVRRPARVMSEPQLQGDRLEPEMLGSATLRRASMEGLVAEELSIPIGSRPATDRIELVIDDGDEAPLKVDRVIAEIGPLPWIWFEVADGRPLIANFDAGREPARYDLEADRDRLSRTDPPRAAWGGPRGPLDGQAPSPVTAEPLPAGGPFDATGYRFKRGVPMATGLVSLLLDEQVLALSPSLNDVRLVTAGGTQVPYVSESRDEPLRVPLGPLSRTEDAEPHPGTTRYALPLPPAGIPASRLALTTEARIFDREVRVVEVRPGADRRAPEERFVLARGRWVSASSNEPAPALVLDLPRTHAERVELEIDEGDNAPLPVAPPELLLPQRRLRFVHPGTALTLWFGADGVAAPRYDLALLSRRVLSERSHDIELGPAPTEVLPATGPVAAAGVVLWGVLGVTLVALAVVLGRLLRGSAVS